MKISGPKIEFNGNQTKVSFDIEIKNRVQKLFFQSTYPIAESISESCDAALVGLFLPAMYGNEDIIIDGMVSDRLLHGMNNVIQDLIIINAPTVYNRVKVTRSPHYSDDNEVYEQTRNQNSIAGFSGGIDSWNLINDCLINKSSERLSHILFSNVGSKMIGGEKLYMERLGRIVPIAKKLGVELLDIRTNLDSFYIENKPLWYPYTGQIRNIAVGLLLQRGISRFYLASGSDYSKTKFGNLDLSYIGALIIPHFSTESMHIVLQGAQKTRLEKTICVSSIKESYDLLDVCWRHPIYGSTEFTNCGQCGKCMTTLATLEAIGKLDLYANQFDMNAWSKVRDRYLEANRSKNDK